MLGHLFIKQLDNQSLDDFVASLPNLIGCERWERRQSSNYIGECYFCCRVLGLDIRASLSDDDEFGEYIFHLVVQVRAFSMNQENLLVGLADCVARVLALGGHEVVRPFDIGHAGSRAIVYRRNPDPSAAFRERVLTEQI